MKQLIGEKAERLDRNAVHQGHLILVNREHPIRPQADPQALEQQCSTQLSALLRACKAKSSITLVSGYRSREEQQDIYERSTRENGAEFTASFVARPGESEHQTGLAVDVGEQSDAIDFIRPAFPDEGSCLLFKKLAAEYGFIQRYQEGKRSLTGIACEPWHYRYVGIPHARMMEQLELCLEEYIAYIKSYSYQNPYIYYHNDNGKAVVYYVPAEEKGSTAVPILEGERHQVSGNNTDGFIVTVWVKQGMLRLTSKTRGAAASCLPSPAKARAWCEINLSHLTHNLEQLRMAMPNTAQIMAVVKADAYGHGSIPVAKHLEQAGVPYFAVAEISEGIVLRKNGVKGDILVLGETCESRMNELVQYKLQQSVISAEYGECLNQYGKVIEVHVKIDTGMNRMGEGFAHKEQLLSIYRRPHLRVRGSYSHLSVSDSLDPVDVAYTHSQIQRFNQTLDELRSEGIDPGIIHIQSSYGVFNYASYTYPMIRPGLAIYGLLSHQNEVKEALPLLPVLSLRARVVLVKDVNPNEPIGYGLGCVTTKPSRIAILSIGYADGIPRALSNREGSVLIHGVKAGIMGRISMDCIIVDVTDIEAVVRGDVATLIGQDGDARITAEQLAEQCGTITNELITRLSHRLERIYVQ